MVTTKRAAWRSSKTLLDRVHELPGVESASLTTAVPMGYFNNADTLTIDGFEPPAGQAAPFAVYGVISPEYFRTLQIPLLRGQDFHGRGRQNCAARGDGE